MIEKYETGTSHFIDRFALTRRFEENLEALLADYGLIVMEFGQNALIKNSWMGSRLKRIDTKANPASLMVKFSPDYVVHKTILPETLFFLDAKVSITPVFFDKQIERIRHHSGENNLQRSHIGDIEREAWFSYNLFYPDVAIVLACPYTEKLILAEWVKNIKCLWCYKGSSENGPIPWNCDECPVFLTDESFGVVVNKLAGGSGTPHTNIDLRSMRTLPEFLFQEFGIKINIEEYNYTMLEHVKEWPLNKTQGTVTWKQYNGAIRKLRNEGLNWLRYRMKDDFFDSYSEFDSFWRANRM